MAVVRVKTRPKPQARALRATVSGWPYNRRPYKRPPATRSTTPQLPPAERSRATWWPSGRRPYKRNPPQAKPKAVDEEEEEEEEESVGENSPWTPPAVEEEEEESVGENSPCNPPAAEVPTFFTSSLVRCEISSPWMDEEEADDDELVSTATSAMKKAVA